MRTIATAAAAAWLLGACGGDAAPLTVSDVRITQPMPGTTVSAGYFELANNTPEPIRVSRISSPQFGKVEMHESVVENGIARMVGLDSLTIPGGSSVTFEPGGKHLMLMQPATDPGTATLEFYANGALVLAVMVEVSH